MLLQRLITALVLALAAPALTVTQPAAWASALASHRLAGEASPQCIDDHGIASRFRTVQALRLRLQRTSWPVSLRASTRAKTNSRSDSRFR